MSERMHAAELNIVPDLELGEIISEKDIILATEAMQEENEQVLGSRGSTLFSNRVKMVLVNAALITLMACSSGREVSSPSNTIPISDNQPKTSLYKDYQESSPNLNSDVADGEDVDFNEVNSQDVHLSSFEVGGSNDVTNDVSSEEESSVSQPSETIEHPVTEGLTDNSLLPTSDLDPEGPSSSFENETDVGQDLEKSRDLIEELHHKYVRNNMKDTLELARSLNFIPYSEYEHPSNMCGPLAASLLYDLGALPEGYEMDISKFWLATPESLNVLLPQEDYSSEFYAGSIAGFDPAAVELNVGDFIYLSGGDFDHMITITEIDELGRLHTITNVEQLDHSFAVQDVLLYDPSNPEEGMFNWWATNDKVGKTGVLGMYVWHLESQ